MNGYSSIDLLGRTGKNLSVMVDGQRMLFRGEPAVPCVLKMNGAESTPSAVVYAGDSIEFVPAVSGAPARRTVKDLLGADFTGGVTVNGRLVDLDTQLNTGDQISTSSRPVRAAPPPPKPAAAEPVKAEPHKTGLPEGGTPRSEPPAPEVSSIEPESGAIEEKPAAPRPNPWEKTPEPSVEQAPPGPALQVLLNGKSLLLPGKPDGTPYYVMDLLEYSGIDFEHLDRGVELQVNGTECAFSQELRSRDDVVIRYLEL